MHSTALECFQYKGQQSLYRLQGNIFAGPLSPLSKETPNEFHSITNTILGTQKNFKGNCE